jgi:hypothetical protein
VTKFRQLTRVVLLATVCLTAANAQVPSPAESLAALEQAAQRSAATWKGLASDLDTRVARLLPCDARATVAITEVNMASEGRLAALSEYLRAAAANAAAETGAARVLLIRETTRASEDPPERADTAAELVAVQLQAGALASAAKQRPSLDDANKVLQQIVAMVKERSSLAEQESANDAAVAGALREMVAAFEAREAALKDQIAAFEAEKARWTGYYAARLARAQTECAITKIVAAPAKPTAGKSK